MESPTKIEFMINKHIPSENKMTTTTDIANLFDYPQIARTLLSMLEQKDGKMFWNGKKLTQEDLFNRLANRKRTKAYRAHSLGDYVSEYRHQRLGLLPDETIVSPWNCALRSTIYGLDYYDSPRHYRPRKTAQDDWY